jgi:fatty-acyl-CoA synthase
MPGPHMDGQSLYELMRDEKVGFSQAVPTIWLMLFQYFDAHPEIDTRAIGLKRIGVGGAATPRSMIERFERDFGADFVQGWGMTETSPIGVIGNLLPKHLRSKDEQPRVKMKQGRGVWGVELKIVGEDGQRLPHDGKAFGHLHVRGPWIASGYFKGEGGSVLDAEGFFPTGDVANIDEDGYVQLVDRAKDVIKSGGEWISSIDLENAASAHPAVAEAAVIGIAHPKWQERPLLIVVKRAGSEVTGEELLTFLAQRVVEVVAARRRGVRRQPAAHGDRKAAEDQAARAVQGLRRRDVHEFDDLFDFSVDNSVGCGGEASRRSHGWRGFPPRCLFNRQPLPQGCEKTLIAG